jgi:polar amino acid transport system permease protein
VDPGDPSEARDRPGCARWTIRLVAVTVAVSLLYALQYYAGGPARLPVTGRVADLAVSPDGRLVAAACADGRVHLWDAKGNWAKRTLSARRSPVVHVAFTPDSAALISVARDGEIRQLDLAVGQLGNVLKGEAGQLRAASTAADGSVLATLGEDGTIRAWELSRREVLQSIGPNGRARRVVAVSADGSRVAAGDGPSIQVWNARTGELVRRLEGYWRDPDSQEKWLGHQQEVTALAFSPDGKMLASGSADTTIFFWSLETGRVVGDAAGHWAAIAKLLFDPKGESILTCGLDNKVRIVRLPKDKAPEDRPRHLIAENTVTLAGVSQGHLSGVSTIALGPEPDTLLSAGNDGTVRLWNAGTNAVVRTEWATVGFLPLWGQLLGIWSLASGLAGLVGLWGLRKLRPWSHLLTLGLHLLGPMVVIGLPLVETLSYPLSWGGRLRMALPLIAVAAWYALVLVVATRRSVAALYQAPRSLPLAEQLMASRRAAKTRQLLYVAAVWVFILVVLYSALRHFNLDFAFMGRFFDVIMTGAGLTLGVSAASVVLAVVLALLGALGRTSRNPVLRGLAGFYVSIVRGTPLLVQIFIWYLGLPRLGITLPALAAGILALGVNYGAYMTEVFRAGIQAIGKGQIEAAHALGMSSAQAFRRVVLPQAFRIVIPPIGNEFIAMMKDSALVSVITVWELTFLAQKYGRQYCRTMETFLIAAAFYWMLTVIFQFLQAKLEARMARGERR